MNKYRTRTIINNIFVEIGKTSEKFLNITGRGYAIDGKINKIIIDKDKEEPYDYVIPETDFVVYNDFYIKQIKETFIDENKYYKHAKSRFNQSRQRRVVFQQRTAEFGFYRQFFGKKQHRG